MSSAAKIKDLTKSAGGFRAASSYIGVAFLFALTGTVFLSSGIILTRVDSLPILRLFPFIALGAGFHLISVLIATGALGFSLVKSIVLNWFLCFFMFILVTMVFFLTLLKVLNPNT